MNIKETVYFGLFFTCLMGTLFGLGLTYLIHAEKQMVTIQMNK